MDHTNTGFAGIALCLPQVVDNISRVVDGHLGKERELDKTIRVVWFSVRDLTVGLLKLAKLLKYERKTQKIHSSVNNHTTYADFHEIKTMVTNNISRLMNYSLVIGEDTLLMLENMWLYMKMLTKEEPDTFAYEVAKLYANHVE